MARDLWLAQRLRDEGLIVEEVAGWQTAGQDNFDGQGGVYHHTAGPSNGRMPSLGTCINGVPGVPGPLTNVLQTRESSGPDHIVVIGGGKANHAGRGGWHGLSGNNSVWGIEIEHTGTEPLPDHRREISIRAMAAMVRGCGATNADLVCQHSEWSYPPGSKIDVATGVNADEWRQLTTNVLQGQPPPLPVPPLESEEDVIQLQIDSTDTLHAIIVGQDLKVYYNSKPPGKGWGQWQPTGEGKVGTPKPA